MFDDRTQTWRANVVLEEVERGIVDFDDAAALPLEMWAGARKRAVELLHNGHEPTTDGQPQPVASATP